MSVLRKALLGRAGAEEGRVESVRKWPDISEKPSLLQSVQSVRESRSAVIVDWQ